MSFLNKSALTGCLVLVMLVAVSPVRGTVPESTAKAELPQPALNLEPAEIVRIVINALANNDDPYPDAGIETTYNFASPSNKANTGPLERFIRAFWRHPLNNIELELPEWSDELSRSGELFLVLFRNAADGTIYVRAMPSSRIERVVSDPEVGSVTPKACNRNSPLAIRGR